MPRPPGTPDPDQWVLRLPPGTHLSVGFSANEIIESNCSVRPNRPNEDRYFTCHFHDKVQLYMVLDGHDGSRACDFAQKHIPSVLLRSELEGGEEATSRAFHSAFMDTEKQFFLSIDPHITRKITLQIEIAQKARNSAEALTMYPEQVEEMQRLDGQIGGGTTVVAALIYNSWLQVANVGDSRAILCYLDGNSRLCTEQLSVDHNTNNEEELRRLGAVGLDPDYLHSNGRLGVHQNTRSIGDHSMKGGYKDIDIISHATKEPGTAEPFIAKPLDTRSITGFLILMTDGLYDAYQSWTGRPAMVNQDLAHLIAQEMDQCRDIAHVAQNVVEKVKQVYKVSCWEKRSPGRIDDITLIVRNFGYPLGTKRRPSEPSSAFHPHPKLQPAVSVPPLPRLDVSAAPSNVPPYPTAPIISTTGPNTSVTSGSPFFRRANYPPQDGFPPGAMVGSSGQGYSTTQGYSTLQPTPLRRVASDEQIRRNLHQAQEQSQSTATLPHRHPTSQEATAAGVGMMHRHDQRYDHRDQQYDHRDQQFDHRDQQFDPKFFSGIPQPTWSQPPRSQPPPQPVQQPQQPPYYQQSSQEGGGGHLGVVHVPVTSSPIQTPLPQPSVALTTSTPPSHRRPASAHGSPYENWQASDNSAAQGGTSQSRVNYENVSVRLTPTGGGSGSPNKRYSDGQIQEKMEKMNLSPELQRSLTPSSFHDTEASTPMQIQPPSTLPVSTTPSGQTRPVPVPRRLKKVPVDQNSPDKRTSNASDEWMYIDDSETPTGPSVNKPPIGEHQMEETDDLTTPIPEEGMSQGPAAKDLKGKGEEEEEEETATESEGEGDDGVLLFTDDLLYDIQHPNPSGLPEEELDDGCMKSYVGFDLPEDLSWEAL